MAKNTAKNIGETVTVKSNDKVLELRVKRTLPTVVIDANACSQLFGLVHDTKSHKLKFYPTIKGKVSGDSADIGEKNIKDWAKLPNGWNVGNRPITPAHVVELVAMMEKGTYYGWAGNMLVIADNPHHEIGGKSMCNSQHTTAAYALAYTLGTLHEKYRKGIELILIDDFTDDIVDLLDNAKQRTTADAIARRGLANAKDAKTVQSVVRFLSFRYSLGKSPLLAKDKINLIDAVHSVQNDARFQPVKSVLECLASQNCSRKDGKVVRGSVGSLTKKLNAKKPSDFRCFGLPYVWWTLAGTILTNGGNTDPAEFAVWANKIAYSDDKSLNTVEMSLREALERHGKKEKAGTSGHWAMCQSIIHAFNLASRAKMPKKTPEYPSIIDVIETKERTENASEGKTESVGMFWQDGNDVAGECDELELSPFTFGEESNEPEDADVEDDTEYESDDSDE